MKMMIIKAMKVLYFVSILVVSSLNGSCKSDSKSYIGLSEEDAQGVARSRNEKFRVVKRDGVSLPVTMDFVQGRINATVQNGKVISYKVE